MKNSLLLVAALSIGLLASCSSDEPAEDTILNGIDLAPAEVIVGEDMTGFNTEVFKAFAEIEDKDDNLIISPFSIATYLSMQANYCSDETRKQIFNVLGSANLDVLNSFNAKMISSLGRLDKSATLNLANSVWYDRLYTLKPNAKENLPEFFAADIFSCNPADANTKQQINNWIKHNTNNLISDFYDGKPFVSMVINTLYFNGSWKEKFAKEDTERQKFQAGDKIYMVDMLNRYNAKEEIAQGSNFTACRRDFGNGAYTCTFILPDEECDINEFISGLDSDELAALEFKNKICDLAVPKFEMGNKFDNLVEVFASLGIQDIDTPIELSQKEILVTVLHESYVKLDEEGAKIAAVTGDNIYWEALNPYKISFRLDRPFIFMINETSTNACILTGRISNFDKK